MPRGIKKTYSERLKDLEWYRERYERRIEKKPLGSPCLPGRLRHEFGRGVGTAQKNCSWCSKSREQIKKEQSQSRVLQNKRNVK